MDVQAVVPILRMHDVAVAKRFYLDWLGCALDWEDGGRTARSISRSRARASSSASPPTTKMQGIDPSSNRLRFFERAS